MPELPEVETVANDLRRLVTGAVILGSRCGWTKTLRSGEPAALDAAVTGRRIVGTGRRAKLVLLDLDDGTVITVHLKMTGQLLVVPADAPVDPHVRVSFLLADGRELRFRDIRKFGRIGVARRDPVTGALSGELGARAGADPFGIEPLEPAFDIRAFRTRVRGRRTRLKPLITDQAVIAGIGNIYADEALWAARLHPLRTARTLAPRDERRLYDELLAILREAVARRGSSVDDYTAPEGDGSMQEHLRVYQRTGDPCERCGRPIRRIVVGSRATHFCSWCQRLPAADRAGAAAILRGSTAGRRPPVRAEAVRSAAATRRAAARASGRAISAPGAA